MNQIVPIQKIHSLEDLSSPKSSAAQSVELPFQSVLQEAINNVKETDAVLNGEIYKLTTGQTDNVHDVMIASQKASLSVDLLVQMRNKLLDSYNEIMRMSI
ncbi:MAG: Flagellar hook-basal body complex protein FliE [Oscillospiraceae bacterium]|jgi:flagellar hook-basal body complex protein FliE